MRTIPKIKIQQDYTKRADPPQEHQTYPQELLNQ